MREEKEHKYNNIKESSSESITLTPQSVVNHVRRFLNFKIHSLNISF